MLPVKHLSVTIIFLSFSMLSGVSAQPDQQLVWGSYYGVLNGQNEYDVIEAIAETPDGGFVIFGVTYSSSGLATVGAHQLNNNGLTDCFIARFDENRERLWATYFGGPNHETPNKSIGVLPDGSLIVSGITASTTNIASEDAYQQTNPGYTGFIARFSPIGELMWSTYYGLGASEELLVAGVWDLVMLPDGDIIVVGDTQSPELMTTANAFQANHAGSFDGFIARFSSGGDLVWSTYFGGPGNDVLLRAVIDSVGDIVVLGTTQSDTQIATNGAYQEEYAGETDLVLLKISAEGQMLWSTYYGGEGHEYNFNSNDLTIDNFDNIYVLSRTTSLNGIATDGAHQTEPDNSGEWEGNVFLARFSSNGTLEWGSYYGSTEITARGVVMQSNNVVITGATISESGLATGNPWQAVFPGTDENAVFISAFTPGGEPIWGTYYGGAGNDVATGAETFSDNLLAIVGASTSTSGISTSDGFQTEQFDIDGFFSFFELDFPTSVAENEWLSITLAPNPARDFVRLNLPPHFTFLADITVYNAVGQVVAQHGSFNSLEPLPLSHPPGLYVVEARNGNQVARGKVVVK